jgi:hypothetical protein
MAKFASGLGLQAFKDCAFDRRERLTLTRFGSDGWMFVESSQYEAGLKPK